MQGTEIDFIDLDNLKKNKKAVGRHQDLADLENPRKLDTHLNIGQLVRAFPSFQCFVLHAGEAGHQQGTLTSLDALSSSHSGGLIQDLSQAGNSALADDLNAV